MFLMRESRDIIEQEVRRENSTRAHADSECMALALKQQKKQDCFLI